MTIAVAAVMVALSAGLVVERGRDARRAGDLSVALRAELESHHLRVWSRPPLGPDSVEGHGFVHYRQAVKLVPGFDRATARAIEEWFVTGKSLPEWAREFVAVSTPGIDALSRGTRTFALGRRPDPGAGLDLPSLNGLALAVEADAILALEEKDPERSLRRALELVRFGSDLTRGGTATEQRAGFRLVERGLRFLETCHVTGVLTPAGRERLGRFLDSELLRPRGADEILSGISLTWQMAYSKVLAGETDGTWNRDGTGWGAELPDLVNPQYLSDDDFIEAWREFRRCIRQARQGFAAGRPSGAVLNQAFRAGAASPNRIHADCCIELTRSIRALLATETALRDRMATLREALEP
jgi:hypothetical protein